MRLWRRRRPQSSAKFLAYRCIYTIRRRHHVRDFVDGRIDRQRLADHRVSGLFNGRDAAGRLTVAGALMAWFALVLAIGAGGALDPIRGLARPLWASPSRCRSRRWSPPSSPRANSDCNSGDPFVRLGGGEYDPNSRRALCASLRAGRTAGAVRAERRLGRHFHMASPLCRSPGRSFASADVSRRSFLRGASSGSQISSTRSRLAPYRRQVRFRRLPVRRRAPS